MGGVVQLRCAVREKWIGLRGPSRFAVTLVLAWSVMLMSPSESAVHAQDAPLTQTLTWVSINDTVMGGRSSGSVRVGEGGELVWSGNLSLENNGGFVSIRSQGAWFDWSDYDGVEVVIEGAGREVQVSAQRRDLYMRAGGYRALVPTEEQGDTALFIPFSAFELKRFGRPISGPPLSEGLGRIGQMGLLIADKREGPFALTLKSLKPARFSDETRSPKALGSTLSRAIEAGVPVFNAGDHKGCALIYAKVLRSLVDTGQLKPKTWAYQLSRHALQKASVQQDTEAAWTLRRAIDALLRSALP